MAPVSPPCVVHEDDELLVVDRPAGWVLRAASPWDGEGLQDWLMQREPRWASLGTPDPADDGASGLLAFGKSAAATRALAAR
ncbi:MAG: RluA family pseudouridine synthase, partial [Gammaproteobacteria bacterium]|nr:RluA family pseudouridine synthase [Gammaproteobacteria bacterium]